MGLFQGGSHGWRGFGGAGEDAASGGGADDWRYVADEDRLQAVFDEHRGRCYEQSITFATLVRLVADALLEHDGSGNQSFRRGQESGELDTTTRAAYGKLGRLPIAVSIGLFDAMSTAIGELFPHESGRPLPHCLQGFTVVTIDGKTMKRVAKRLKPLRGTSGGAIGGKALVATEYTTNTAIALAADLDGDANDIRLVPDLLPRVRRRTSGPRLWLADSAYCDLLQTARFIEENDSFLLRYNAKTKFVRDETAAVNEGVDDEGCRFVDERGWLGADSNRHRRDVRRITLQREDGGKVAIVTDLLCGEAYPAKDLLELYRQRWGIEQVFQQVTQVFGLERLIGGRAEATIFQFAFCLLLYNQTQLVRAYVAKHAQWEPDLISLEQVFIDVRRELIAWTVVVGPIDLPQRSADETSQRLDQLLRHQWTDRWLKAIRTSPRHKPPPKKGKHTSVFKAMKRHKP